MTFRPSDLTGRQVHGTAALLGALREAPTSLGAISQLAALGRPPLTAGELVRWALTVPAERLGAIGALIANPKAAEETAAPIIEHHPAPVRVSADHPRRNSAGRRRSRQRLH